jgi:hypothetical protein
VELNHAWYSSDKNEHALLSRRKVRINLCRQQNSSKPQTRADDDDGD